MKRKKAVNEEYMTLGELIKRAKQSFSEENPDYIAPQTKTRSKKRNSITKTSHNLRDMIREAKESYKREQNKK